MLSVKEIIRRSKHYLKVVVSLRSSPENIALSFAIGTFIAIIPMFGVGILIGLMIAILFKKLNKIALMLAFVVWNPLFTVPLFALSGKIGDILFHGVEVMKYEIDFFNHLFTFTRRFMIGNLMLDVILSVFSYFVIKKLFYWYKKRKQRRQEQRLADKKAYVVISKE